LKSHLSNLKDIPYNYVSVVKEKDYGDFTKSTFKPILAPNTICPQVDYPSFQWLNVNELEMDTKVINKVAFKICLVKIPQCIEDTTPQKLEEFAYKFVKKVSNELYVNFPFQTEAVPMFFEDK
jgi:cbb3-type cytochrome oxidase cytochrome c subunit